MGSANGIEYLEVRDRLEPVPAHRQRTLFVRLLRPGFTLSPDNLAIDGGARLEMVSIEWVAAADDLPAGTDPALVEGIDDLPRTLVIRTAASGDFSRYTLRLRASSGSDEPPAGFDPRLSSIEFSFKVECPSDFDCAAQTSCPPERPATPQIDYLAKDYPGFRRLMLDRMSLLAPGWRERSAADVGVALVELLAYAADNLSYRQDAIANEAYLSTAHRRVSVRRHARLVDYALHEGCNARAWVRVEVDADHLLAKRTQMLTRTAGMPVMLTPGSKDVDDAIAAGALVFEAAQDKHLFTDNNSFAFYTWGDNGCCLPRGATSATLEGEHPQLRPGDVIVFMEVVSPTTFTREDADRTKRWAVRLTSVVAGVDPSGGLFTEAADDTPVPVTEIAWSAADALPFPVCISVKDRPELKISIVLGNIVLVDHGQTVHEEIGAVPTPYLYRGSAPAHVDGCADNKAELIPIRFRPALSKAPLTYGFHLESDLDVPFVEDEGWWPGDDAEWWPATALIARDPHEALPLVTDLVSEIEPVETKWTPQRDLLASAAGAADFVVETENDGTARLRFGDGEHGRRPEAGTTEEPHLFTATYRVGNGTSGNVGASAIAHIIANASGIFASIGNPMPAAGGVDPEDIEAARRDAPEAFRTQERAVTAADYAVAAERRVDVQRAAATFRWTGSWHTVFVTADRVGGGAVDSRFEGRLRRHLERFRMAGYDLEVDAPRYVPLEVSLHVCVKPDYFRSDVLRDVLAELGSGMQPDGRRGIFHPDNFSFGDAVYASRIVAAAQAVEGVEAVSVQKFQRMAAPDPASIENGVIPMGRLEIAQLANDPNFRERGRLTIEAGGGK